MFWNGSPIYQLIHGFFVREMRKMKICVGLDVHKEKCAGYATRKDGRKDKTGRIDEFNEKFRRFPSNCGGM